MNLLNVLILSHTAAAKMHTQTSLFSSATAGLALGLLSLHQRGRADLGRKEKNVNHTHMQVLCLQYLVFFSSIALPLASSVFSGRRHPFSMLCNKARS